MVVSSRGRAVVIGHFDQKPVARLPLAGQLINGAVREVDCEGNPKISVRICFKKLTNLRIHAIRTLSCPERSRYCPALRGSSRPGRRCGTPQARPAAPSLRRPAYGAETPTRWE